MRKEVIHQLPSMFLAVTPMGPELVMVLLVELEEVMMGMDVRRQGKARAAAVADLKTLIKFAEIFQVRQVG